MFKAGRSARVTRWKMLTFHISRFYYHFTGRAPQLASFIASNFVKASILWIAQSWHPSLYNGCLMLPTWKVFGSQYLHRGISHDRTLSKDKHYSHPYPPTSAGVIPCGNHLVTVGTRSVERSAESLSSDPHRRQIFLAVFPQLFQKALHGHWPNLVGLYSS